MSSSAFRDGDLVVYPAHGVGKVEMIETQEVSGFKLDVFVISFNKDRMTLRLPVAKAKAAGLRHLSTTKDMDDALKTLNGRIKIKKQMWNRRAQEYEAKINSGDPVSIAEVVRELHRPEDDQEQSFSERQMYRAALERLVRELAAVESIEEDHAADKIKSILNLDAA